MTLKLQEVAIFGIFFHVMQGHAFLHRVSVVVICRHLNNSTWTFKLTNNVLHTRVLELLMNVLFCWFSMGLWLFSGDHHQLCISLWSLCSSIHEQGHLQDSPAFHGVSSSGCPLWQWNFSSDSTCKFSIMQFIWLQFPHVASVLYVHWSAASKGVPRERL